MQITRSSDGSLVEVSEILTYRCSTIKDTGRPVTWHKWGDENCVAMHFDMDYDELTAARSLPEWNDFAKKWAEDNKVDFKHVQGAKEQPRNGSIKKSDLEAIGKKAVEILEERSSHSELEEEEYQTTKEWVDENVDKFWGADFNPTTRPIKPKKTTQIQQKIDTAVDESLEAAKQNARDAGLSEEEIAKIFG